MSIHLSVCPSPKLKNIIKSLYNQHQDIKSHQVDNQLWSTIDWDWQSTIDWDWQLSEINNHLINNWLRSTIDWYWQMTEINFSSIYCDFQDFSSCLDISTYHVCMYVYTYMWSPMIYYILFYSESESCFTHVFCPTDSHLNYPNNPQLKVELRSSKPQTV